MLHRPRASLLTACAALTIMLLAGCASPVPAEDSGASPEPTPSEQTVGAACAVILEPIVAVGEQMEALEANASSDPQSVVDGFTAAAEELIVVSETLENTDVKSTLDTAILSLTNVSTSLQAIIDDPANADFDAFQASLDSIVADFGAIDTLCAG